MSFYPVAFCCFRKQNRTGVPLWQILFPIASLLLWMLPNSDKLLLELLGVSNRMKEVRQPCFTGRTSFSRT